MLHAHATESLLRRGGRASPSHASQPTHTASHAAHDEDPARRSTSAAATSSSLSSRTSRQPRGSVDFSINSSRIGAGQGVPGALGESSGLLDDRRRRVKTVSGTNEGFDHASSSQHQHRRSAHSADRESSVHSRDKSARRNRTRTRAEAEELWLHQKLGRIMREASQARGTQVHANVVGAVIHEQDRVQDRHVEYDVECTMQISGFSRRYTEFKELDTLLRRRFPGLKLPTLPDISRRFKLFTRRSFDPEYVMSKGNLLNAYLSELAATPAIRCSPEFLAFVMNATGGPFSQKNAAPRAAPRTVLYKVQGHRSSSLPPESHVIDALKPSASTPVSMPAAIANANPHLVRSNSQPTEPGYLPVNIHQRRQPSLEAYAFEEAINSSDAMSSDESDWEDDLFDSAKDEGNGDGPALIETSWRAASSHPLISQTRGLALQASLPGCSTLGEALETATLIVHLERLNVDLSLYEFELDERGRLSGRAWIDGRQLEITGQFTDASPPSKESTGTLSIALKT